MLPLGFIVIIKIITKVYLFFIGGEMENESKTRSKIKKLIRFLLSSFDSGKQKEKLFKHCGIFVRAGGLLQFILTL